MSDPMTPARMEVTILDLKARVKTLEADARAAAVARTRVARTTSSSAAEAYRDGRGDPAFHLATAGLFLQALSLVRVEKRADWGSEAEAEMFAGAERLVFRALGGLV